MSDAALESQRPRRRVEVKGRGHEVGDVDLEDREQGRGGKFESVEQSSGSGPAKSIEGWIIFITNVHPEAQEDDIMDKFSDFGKIKNISVNLDRRTGFVKGYALVEYENQEEASDAISNMDGVDMLDQAIGVSWAFVK